MVNSEPSIEEIEKAIKTSGYLIEQEIATLFESLSFNVQTNRAFEDPDDKKSREIDVWAIKRIFHDESNKLSVFIEFLCESKNNTNPFVFIGRNKAESDIVRPPKEFLFPIDRYEVTLSQEGNKRTFREIPAFNYLKLEKDHYHYKTDFKSVQFCKIVRDRKSWKANHEGIYNAIFYPLVKALLYRQSEVKKLHGDWKYVWLFFPIVVLNGSIYYLDSTSDKVDLKLKPFITFVRELKAENIEGYFMVDFVSKGELSNYISTCVLPFSERITEIADNSPNVLLNRNNPLNVKI